MIFIETHVAAAEFLFHFHVEEFVGFLPSHVANKDSLFGFVPELPILFVLGN